MIHARGRTTVTSAIQGYVRSLRDDGHVSETSASAARGHAAKASLIRAATAKRQSALMVRSEAEQVIHEVTEAAIRRLTEARLPATIPAPAGTSFRSEIALACHAIEAAKARALAALASGDMALLDGPGRG